MYRSNAAKKDKRKAFNSIDNGIGNRHPKAKQVSEAWQFPQCGPFWDGSANRVLAQADVFVRDERARFY